MYESVLATVTVAIGRMEHVLNRDRYQDGLPGRELAHALTKLQEANTGSKPPRRWRRLSPSERHEGFTL